MSLHYRTPPEGSASTGVPVMLRAPSLCLLVLLLGTACGGPKRPPAVAPEPKSAPPAKPADAVVIAPPPPAPELDLLPPAPALDTLVPASELERVERRR